MTQFVNETIMDIRRGQQSWRVFTILCAPTFVISLLLNVIR